MTGLRRVAVVLAVMAAAGPDALAATRPERPDAFLRRIYAPLFKDSDQALPTDPDPPPTYDAQLEALFEESDDLAAKAGDIPPIDGESLCDCQEWSALRDFSIRLQRLGPTRCDAIVHFTNMGRSETLAFKLVLTRQGWRVADIGDDVVPSLVGDLTRWIAQERKVARGSAP